MNIINLLIVLLFLIGAGVGGFLMYKQKKEEHLCFRGDKKIPCQRNLAVENIWQNTTCY